MQKQFSQTLFVSTGLGGMSLFIFHITWYLVYLGAVKPPTLSDNIHGKAYA